MKSILILILTVFTFAANAQNLDRQKQRIHRLAQRIQNQVQNSPATGTELHRTIQLLQEALSTLTGRPRPPSPEPEQEYICVPRDNDGRAPYSLAIRDDNFDIKKTRQVFDTVNECEQTIQRIQTIDSTQVLCAPRDRDGRAPYSLYQLKGTDDVKFEKLGFSTIKECEQTLEDRVQIRTGAALCASRDMDGRNPWSIFTVDFQNLTVDKKDQTFNSYLECTNQLR